MTESRMRDLHPAGRKTGRREWPPPPLAQRRHCLPPSISCIALCVQGPGSAVDPVPSAALPPLRRQAAAALGAAVVALSAACGPAPAAAADLVLGREVFEANCGACSCTKVLAAACSLLEMGHGCSLHRRRRPTATNTATAAPLLSPPPPPPRCYLHRRHCPAATLNMLTSLSLSALPRSPPPCRAAVCHAGGLNNIPGEEKHTLKRNALEHYRLFSSEAIESQVHVLTDGGALRQVLHLCRTSRLRVRSDAGAAAACVPLGMHDACPPQTNLGLAVTAPCGHPAGSARRAQDPCRSTGRPVPALTPPPSSSPPPAPRAAPQVRAGKDAMPPFQDSLSDEEIAAVAAFVYNQAAKDLW